MVAGVVLFCVAVDAVVDDDGASGGVDGDGGCGGVGGG